MFTRLFSPVSTMVRLDESEAERLRHAADRLLRQQRAAWGKPSIGCACWRLPYRSAINDDRDDLAFNAPRRIPRAV